MLISTDVNVNIEIVDSSKKLLTKEPIDELRIDELPLIKKKKLQFQQKKILVFQEKTAFSTN